MATVEDLRFAVEGRGEVSALLSRPAKAGWLLVLAHGAGAGMSHPFMAKLADELASVGVATLRYQFPYMEERRRIPDAPAVLTATVVAAVLAAAKAAPGFPLHPPNRPATKRADHLAKVTAPMLFLQGTRDTFADLQLVRPVCAKLGSRATLHVIETADHSFHVLKSSGRTDAEVLRELAETTISWANGIEKTQAKPAQGPAAAAPAQKPPRN